MKPIIIDAATIFDPARLIAVLASVDVRHSEVWVSQRYDHIKDKDFITGFGTDTKFALLPDPSGRFKADPLEVPKANERLDPTGYMTGPKILRWALSKGMAVPKDLYRYEELAISLESENKINGLSEAIMLGAPAEHDIRAGEQLTEEYLKRTGRKALGPEYAWRLEPYGIGHGLGLILAAAQEENVEPFISHPNFRDNVSTHNYTYYERERRVALATEQKGERESYVIQDAISLSKTILSCPEPVDISQVAFYLEQKDRIEHISGIITASDDLETRSKDIGIMTSTAVGTYAVDLAVFGGLPVTSGLKSLYDVGTRFFKGKS
ncbi:MAG: hypothetical protein ABJ360_24225 [Roseobacter sp.]